MCFWTSPLKMKLIQNNHHQLKLKRTAKLPRHRRIYKRQKNWMMRWSLCLKMKTLRSRKGDGIIAKLISNSYRARYSSLTKCSVALVLACQTLFRKTSLCRIRSKQHSWLKVWLKKSRPLRAFRQLKLAISKPYVSRSRLTQRPWIKRKTTWSRSLKSSIMLMTTWSANSLRYWTISKSMWHNKKTRNNLWKKSKRSSKKLSLSRCKRT